jgi:hypothetical protein
MRLLVSSVSESTMDSQSSQGFPLSIIGVTVESGEFWMEPVI